MNLKCVAIAVAVAFIAGCNTMHGVGEDISAGGRKVEDVLKNDKKPASESSSTSSTVNTPSTPGAATSGADADRTRTSPDTSMSTPPSGTSTQ